MNMEITKVIDCNAVDCAYNRDNNCQAIAITVGGGTFPMCDTSIKGKKKGGVSDWTAGVGACKVAVCRFNDAFECAAEKIRVKTYSNRPRCATFVSK